MPIRKYRNFSTDLGGHLGPASRGLRAIAYPLFCVGMATWLISDGLGKSIGWSFFLVCMVTAAAHGFAIGTVSDVVKELDVWFTEVARISDDRIDEVEEDLRRAKADPYSHLK